MGAEPYLIAITIRRYIVVSADTAKHIVERFIGTIVLPGIPASF
jgi:hypothetical protein